MSTKKTNLHIEKSHTQKTYRKITYSKMRRKILAMNTAQQQNDGIYKYRVTPKMYQTEVFNNF